MNAVSRADTGRSPEWNLARLLSLLDFEDWQRLHEMFSALRVGQQLDKPVDSHKVLASRLKLRGSAFSKFRRRVLRRLAEVLSGEGDLISKPVPRLTDRGKVAEELADWLVRTARETTY